MRKHLIYILCTIMAGIAVITLLASKALMSIPENNGFNRKFMSTKLQLSNAVRKDKEITGVIGIHQNTIFFKTKDPARLITMNRELKDLRGLFLHFSAGSRLRSLFITELAYPYVYIMGGNAKQIIIANINSSKVTVYNFPPFIFTRAVKISHNSFVFRGFDKAHRPLDQIFVKGYPNQKTIKQKVESASEHKADAGLTTDGILQYDSLSKRLFYLHYYNNQFLCLDTNLNIIYHGNTIDTTRIPQTITGAVEKKRVFTNIGPKRIINRYAWVDGKYLYNYSSLKADNESGEKFKNGSAIDVYEVGSGVYAGSFYIPFYKEQKAISFSVFGSMLVALYPDYIGTYVINN